MTRFSTATRVTASLVLVVALLGCGGSGGSGSTGGTNGTGAGGAGVAGAMTGTWVTHRIDANGDPQVDTSRFIQFIDSSTCVWSDSADRSNCTYTSSGTTVSINRLGIANSGDAVFALADGCLDGGALIGKFCKQ